MKTVVVVVKEDFIIHDDRLHCHEDGCHGDEVNLYVADPIDFISDIRIAFYD